MIIGIAHTTLIIRDYDEAKDFYCDKLGFKVVEDTQLDKRRWMRLKALHQPVIGIVSFLKFINIISFVILGPNEGVHLKKLYGFALGWSS